MPICKNCNQKWSWKQTVKKMTTLNSEMTCPYCGEKQYQSKKSKAIAPFLGLIILLPLLIQFFIDLPIVITLSLIPILAGIIFVIYPFAMKLSNEEESNFLKDK